MTAKRWQEEYLNRCRGVIHEHGWMVQGVFTPGGTGTQFAYTAGLTAVGLPELVIVGLPAETGGDVLNLAARGHTTTEIKPGDLVDVDWSVMFLAVAVSPPAARRYLGTAHALYGETLRAIQLVWPDDEGNRPGDPGWTGGDAQDLRTAALS